MLLKDKKSLLYYLTVIFLIIAYVGYRVLTNTSLSDMNFIVITFSGVLLAGVLFMIYSFKIRKEGNLNLIQLVLFDFFSLMLMLVWLYVVNLFASQNGTIAIIPQVYILVSILVLVLALIASILYNKKTN